jgi:hypothetical protein
VLVSEGHGDCIAAQHMTLDDALGLWQEAFVGLPIDELRCLQEADQVIRRAVDEGLVRWSVRARSLRSDLAASSNLGSRAPVALASALADALITFVLRRRGE